MMRVNIVQYIFRYSSKLYCCRLNCSLFAMIVNLHSERESQQCLKGSFYKCCCDSCLVSMKLSTFAMNKPSFMCSMIQIEACVFGRNLNRQQKTGTSIRCHSICIRVWYTFPLFNVYHSSFMLFSASSLLGQYLFATAKIDDFATLQIQSQIHC